MVVVREEVQVASSMAITLVSSNYDIRIFLVSINVLSILSLVITTFYPQYTN